MGHLHLLASLWKFPATAVFVVLIAILSYEWARHRNHRMPWTERQKIACSFLAVWAIYLSNFRWRGAGDVVADSLLPFSLIQHGNIYLDQFAQTFLGNNNITLGYAYKGHWLSIYCSANGIMLIPFYLLHVLMKIQPTDLLVHQLQKIGASCYVAASVVLIYQTLKRHIRPSQAVLLSAAYAFGTCSWSTSSQAIWQHGPSQFFLSLALYALFAMEDSLRAALLAGFAFAMAVWCRYTDLLLYLPLWVCLVYYSPRKALRFTLGSVLPVMALLADNVAHTGHLLLTGQHMIGEQNRFFTPFWVGLSGILFSPARGLLAYSPFLAAGLIGGLQEARKPRDPLYRFMAIGAALNICLYSKWHDWGGGWCYGTRNLADLGPYLVLFIPSILASIEKKKNLYRLFIFSIGYSIFMQALGAYITWRWEEPMIPSAWAAARYPLVYLFGMFCKSSPV